jgi:hypothetical protein
MDPTQYTLQRRGLHKISSGCKEKEGPAYRIDTQMGMHVENPWSNPRASRIYLCNIFICSRVEIDSD